MSKVDDELKIEVRGFIQIEVDDDITEDELDRYLGNDYSDDSLLYELKSGKFNSETELDVEILNHAVIDEDEV